MRTQPEVNAYSNRWFEFFHVGITETRTAQEVDFVCACAPLFSFRKVVDVCCGMGRHARALSSRGYSVTGVERDAAAVAKSRLLGGGPSYIQADVCDYQPDACAYDLAIVMSQSFGHFDTALNRDLLRRLATGVRRGGRVVLDLWNPDFFATHQGERNFELPGGIVRETKHVENGRLFVHLDYPDEGADDFVWQLFPPAEMTSLADSIGLDLIVSCTEFDASTKPTPAKPRLQFVLERRDGPKVKVEG
ncbi:MAG: class I SAM-dependent methyltransferase [Chthoniobacterales bacterium]|nr:class I SAM-dependent methyltransferase [Chthoniobacterales bacterium]